MARYIKRLGLLIDLDQPVKKDDIVFCMVMRAFLYKICGQYPRLHEVMRAVRALGYRKVAPINLDMFRHSE